MNNTILFKLVNDNKYNELKEYFKQKDSYDLNIRDDQGNFLLTYAIVRNNYDIIKLLLDNGCKTDIFDQDGKSILYIPIKYGYDKIIQLLLSYEKHNIGISIVDLKDHSNNIPIHYAIHYKNINVVKLLLDMESNTNTIDNNGNNSLHLAIYTRDEKIVELVLKTNININARTTTGESALHIACNFKLNNIIQLLVKHGIDVNIRDYENEITALFYCVNLNNVNMTKYLIENTADINIQDYIGNTILHYAIYEENNEIINYLLSEKLLKTINVNLYNILSKYPIHTLLEKDIINTEALKILLRYSNLNFQDTDGDTPLILLFKKNIWTPYKEILITKKINIFIENKNNMSVYDIAKRKSKNESDMKAFMDMVISSYMYILKNNNNLWDQDWENICAKDKLTLDEQQILEKYIKSNKIKNNNKDNETICYSLIENKINNIISKDSYKCNNTSYPQKKNKKCIIVDGTNKVELCSFTGVTLDILIGLIYLLQKHKNSCSTITNNFIKNKNLCEYYQTLNISVNTKCEFLNFEIVWVYKKLFLSDNFAENFKKCISNSKVEFIIIPLGIELYEGSHANYLIYNKKTKELERFEPYGYDAPYKFNYNPKLLDNIISFKFSEIDSGIIYIKPSQYLPKVGFQSFEVSESKTRKIGDPGGFCALWAIWYVDMRLTYPEIDRKKLTDQLLKEIKKQLLSFKNVIRNYSINILNIRNMIFDKAGITINDWINDQYTEEQMIDVIDEIKKLLNN